MEALRIRIIGGSLAGLFAAVLLTKRGHDVRIYERSLHGLSGRGAGLLGKKETFAMLRAAGCEHVARIGVTSRERITFHEFGSTVEPAMAQAQLSWDHIYRTLRSLVPNGCYLLGRELKNVSQDAAAAYLAFADGDNDTADLVIGADGLGSVVRRAVAGAAAASSYAGYVGWRGLLPETALSSTAAAELLDRFAFYKMPHSHAIGFLVPGPNAETAAGSRRYNWVWYRPVADGDSRNAFFTDVSGNIHPYSLPPGSVPPSAREALIRDAADLLPSALATAIASTAQPFMQGVFDFETPAMSNGRLALIGDAAFVVRPHTGSGVAKAAGDVFALDTLLSTRPLVEALREYHDERAPVGSSIAAYGRRLGSEILGNEDFG